ncbi:MAG: O-antigen ligase family protein [Burkholderiaceae bacterium]|nr:O-antigen ligase family protein [Burkholderiaceae bacterium]
MHLAIGWLPPLGFALLVYVAVDNYGLSPNGYNRQVGEYVFIAAATLLVGAMISGRELHVSRRLLFWAAVFSMSVAVSVWGAANLYGSLNRLHLYYSILLFGIALYVVHAGSVDDVLNRYLLLVPLVHAVFLVYVVFWVISLQAGSGLPATGAPHYANIRHFAYHGFIAAAFATSLFVRTSRLQATAFVLTTAALFGIILLGARGAIGAWLVFVAAAIVLGRSRKQLFVFCASALMLSAGSVYFLGAADLVRAPSLFYRFGEGIGRAAYVADRLEIWMQAFNAILRRPAFGYGPEGYIFSACCNSAVAQPHNFVLQFLLEFGFVGCALFAKLCIVVWQECGGGSESTRKRWSNMPPGLVVLTSAVLAFLAYALIDGLLYHAIALVHFALLVVLFVGATRGTCRPDKSPSLLG